MKVNAIQDWLNDTGSHIVGSLKLLFSAVLSPQGYSLTITSQVGGGSWCAFPNGSEKIVHIHLGIPEWFAEEHPSHQKYADVIGKEPGEHELYIYFRGLAIHEFMHAYITRPGNIVTQLQSKFPMAKKNPTVFERQFYEINIAKVFRFLLNAAEDARIENIGKAKYNIEECFNFMRLLDYTIATEGSGSKIWDFGYAILQLGAVGCLPRFEMEQEAKDALEELQAYYPIGAMHPVNLLDQFLCEPDPAQSIAIFSKFFDVPKVHAYVAKMLKESIEDASGRAKKLQDLMEKLEENDSEFNPPSGSGTTPFELGPAGGKVVRSNAPDPYALELPQNITPKKARGNQQDEANDDGSSDGQSNNGQSGNNNTGDDEADGNGGGDGADRSDKDTDEDATGTGTGEEASQSQDEETSSGNDGSGTGSDSSEDQEENADSSGQQDSQADDGKNSNAGAGQSNAPDSKQSKGSAGKTFKNGKWQTNASAGKGTKQAERFAEDEELKKELKATLDKMTGSIDKALDTMHKSEQQKKSRAATASKNPTHTVERSAAGEIVRETFTDSRCQAPEQVLRHSRPLRRAFEKWLSQNKEYVKRHAPTGKLDLNSVYKMDALKDPYIFKKSVDNSTSAAGVILWDGSGSMNGQKQYESGVACAIIEEALRGLCPLKIVNFFSSMGHHLVTVKDFDDAKRVNHAYSYAHQRSFSGGNRDGLAIQDAVAALNKRGEQNKFIIVLSDGAPSAYSGEDEGVRDVRESVAEARKYGINVASIFFGDPSELTAMIGSYREMYGSSVIACAPEQITAHLKKMVEKNLFR